MKTLKNMTGDSLEQMIDYKVVDQNGDSIGTLHSLWSDPTTGAVEFLGVKTGWIFGQNHVVPAEKAELDEAESVVRLPYTGAFIKEAPAISAEAEISEEEEEQIYQYYGLGAGQGMATDSAPGNNQPGVNYDTMSSETPEAIGGAGIANASEAGMGGTQFGGPSSTDADATLASVSRLRRTSRPDSTSLEAGGPGTRIGPAAPSTGNPGTRLGNALDQAGQTGGTAQQSATGTSPGSFATSNMFGSTATATAPVSADSLGASSVDPEMGMSAALAENLGRNVTDPGDENAGLTHAGGPNADPITGEPGSHPIGAGAGALAAGAAGAAIGGAIGGPIGAPLGAVIGAVVGGIGGGYAGKGIAESMNPTEEDAYWKSNYQKAPYLEQGAPYSDYSPAYRVGYEGYAQYAESGRDFNAAEADLERDYHGARGSSNLTWDKAKAATRDAWERLKNKEGEANPIDPSCLPQTKFECPQATRESACCPGAFRVVIWTVGVKDPGTVGTCKRFDQNTVACAARRGGEGIGRFFKKNFPVFRHSGRAAPCRPNAVVSTGKLWLKLPAFIASPSLATISPASAVSPRSRLTCANRSRPLSPIPAASRWR